MSDKTLQSINPFIQAEGLIQIHRAAELEVVALRGLDLSVPAGQLLALVGPSGSGKSSLLNLLGGLERPSAGRLVVAGQELQRLGPIQLGRFRRGMVGFLWQQTARNLVPYLSARQNIALLTSLAELSAAEGRAWTEELLMAVGIQNHARRRPGELSGGQQQRVALACALANRPRLLLADEPTGEVDWPTAQRLLALLHELRERYGLTVVCVTHDARVAAAADRVVQIVAGQVQADSAPPAPAAPRPPECAAATLAARLYGG